MNLEDIIDPKYGLQQDEWSLSKPRFGEHNQLEVVGWSGKSKDYAKYYIVQCHKCSSDPELFGDSYFKSAKSSLIKGRYPCGCSKNVLWNKEQYRVRLNRKAKELGYRFIDFYGEWNGVNTRVSIECPVHGVWSTATICMIVNMTTGCPTCKGGVLKPDEVMIQSFFDSGAFHPDTKFWRSHRKDSQNKATYWNIYCPECGFEGESSSGNLQFGSRPCMCSNQRQDEAYINIIKDSGTPLAIKFGIANNSRTRVKRQNSKSFYSVENLFIYKFETRSQCIKAEFTCKKELVCKILSSEEMPDGWTETTYLHNIDNIISIYEKYGGTRL